MAALDVRYPVLPRLLLLLRTNSMHSARSTQPGGARANKLLQADGAMVAAPRLYAHRPADRGLASDAAVRANRRDRSFFAYSSRDCALNPRILASALLFNRPDFTETVSRKDALSRHHHRCAAGRGCAGTSFLAWTPSNQGCVQSQRVVNDVIDRIEPRGTGSAAAITARPPACARLVGGCCMLAAAGERTPPRGSQLATTHLTT